MERLDQQRVELQERLSPRADDIRAPAPRPVSRDMLHEGFGRAELPAAGTVHADKVRIAKFAHGLFPVLLAARPQIAAGKAQEDGRPAGLGALPLQGQIAFLDAIGHRAVRQPSKPRLRSMQAGHSPQP